MVSIILLWPLLFLVALAIVLWAIALLFVNDFAVPSRNVTSLKKVLVVFPHADDETNLAGLLWRLGRQHTSVTLAVLTNGDRGTPDAHRDSSLAACRAQEMQGVCRLLGISEYIQGDFSDGSLDSETQDLREYLSKLLQRTQPELVITYDLAGMYGHPDHIACSRATRELLHSQHKNVSLWYIAFPKRVREMLKLPEHMAKDPHFRDGYAKANCKVPVGLGVIAKVAAVYAHKSQRQSFRSTAPFHLPLWLIYSLPLFEYFEVTEAGA